MRQRARSTKAYHGTSNRADLALAALIIAMCAALLIYLMHTLSGGA